MRQAGVPAGDGEHLVRGDVQHHGAQKGLDAQGVYLIYIALGVFRAGELLSEGVQPEARMDALLQDAAQFLGPLGVPQTALRKSGRKSCIVEEELKEEEQP